MMSSQSVVDPIVKIAFSYVAFLTDLQKKDNFSFVNNLKFTNIVDCCS